MRKFRYGFALFWMFFSFFSTLSLAQTSPSSWGDWDDARILYDAGKYNEALASLAAKPNPTDPAYFYNCGIIYYRLGRMGYALAHFEKANRLSPHDSNIQTNLKLVRDLLAQQLGKERVDPASSFLENVADRVALDEVRATLGLLVLVIALLVLKNYWKSRQLLFALTRPATILVGFALLITGTLYVAQRYSEIHPPSICVVSDTLRSGPGERFLDLGKAEAGMKLRLTGVSSQNTVDQGVESWLQVHYSQDGVGWIKSSSLLLL